MQVCDSIQPVGSDIQPTECSECVLVYSKQKQCQASFYFNDSTYSAVHSHQKPCVSEFSVFFLKIFGCRCAPDQVREGFLIYMSVHALWDFSSRGRMPPPLRNEHRRSSDTTERTQQRDHLWCVRRPVSLRSENSESDRPHLKEIERDLCMCDTTKVYIISKFVNYGSLTQK